VVGVRFRDVERITREMKAIIRDQGNDVIT
jgi:hypothetical protein